LKIEQITKIVILASALLSVSYTRNEIGFKNKFFVFVVVFLYCMILYGIYLGMNKFEKSQRKIK